MEQSPESSDDLLTPERIADPFPIFAEMRQRNPVHWNAHYGAWFIYRFDDVSRALHLRELSSDRITPVFENKLDPAEQAERAVMYEHLAKWMVFQDPPEHTRMRKLVSRAFTPRAIEAQRPRIHETVNSILSEISDRGEFDLINDLAYHIPAIVIAGMLGVPAEDRGLFKQWSGDLMLLVFGARGISERHEHALRGLNELLSYIHTLIRKYRITPANNLISQLVRVQDDHENLSDDEVLATCVLLLFGGHETTTNLIGNGMRALLQHPRQLKALQQEPQIIGGAIEEILRFDGPSKMQVRMAVEDVEIGGQTIRAGDMVYLVQSSANRDEQRFAAANELRLKRKDADSHIGFGFGLHYCLGASLARLEGRIAIGSLVERLPSLVLTGEETWHPTLITRAMSSMMVTFEPSQVAPAR
jgi:cytochrome P450